MKRRMRISACVLIFLVLLLWAHWKKTTAKADMFAMDTVIEFRITGRSPDAALAAAQKEVARLDKLLDADGSGLLGAFNRGDSPEGELWELIQRCRKIKRQTNGSLDIELYDLIRLWGFTTNQYHVPSDEEIQKAQSGRRIDLGAVAKGYGADCVRGVLDNFAPEQAVISLGGTVLLYGNKEINVAITDVDGSGCAGVIRASDCVISTSGAYERYFEQNGMRYGHILDPKTGYPAQNGLLSVTVLAQEGLVSDALSTALFVMGEEQAKTLWHEGGFECVLITDDGRLIVSEALDGKFIPANETYRKEVWHRE